MLGKAQAWQIQVCCSPENGSLGYDADRFSAYVFSMDIPRACDEPTHTAKAGASGHPGLRRQVRFNLPLERHPLQLSDSDPSAPTDWARLVWAQNPDSALAIRHGDDHVSFQRRFRNHCL
jgi:hypothetical protein